ncbi:MAG: hypothetical protein JNG88_06530 [Phycisphaerales bacterium]|nr:hypothetical protein [Phycisphaerales bacterium]
MIARLSRTQVALIVLALLIRLTWVGAQSARDGGSLTYDDEHLHWQLATNLVHRGELVSDDGRYAARTPLYPIFLALFAGMGPSGVIAARLAQALLSTLTVAIGTALADRLAGRRPATVAATFLCFDPFSVFFAALLLNEVAFATVLMGLVAMLHSSPAGQFRFGPALGLAALAVSLVMLRPESIALLGLFAVAALFQLPNLASPARIARLAQLSSSAALLVAALGLWGWRNHTIFGEWVFLSCNGGVTLYDGVGPQADGSSNQSFLREMPELASLSEPQRDRRLTELAAAEIARDPIRFAWLALHKVARTWSLTPNVESHRTGAAATVSALYTLTVLSLVAVGLARHCRRAPALWSLLIPLLFSLMVTAVYIGSVRYRVPYMPLMAVLAGFAIAIESRPPRAVLDRIQPA